MVLTRHELTLSGEARPERSGVDQETGFQKLTFSDFRVPDLRNLGRLLVDPEPLWSSLCTHSELMTS